MTGRKLKRRPIRSPGSADVLARIADTPPQKTGLGGTCLWPWAVEGGHTCGAGRFEVHGPAILPTSFYDPARAAPDSSARDERNFLWDLLGAIRGPEDGFCCGIL